MQTAIEDNLKAATLCGLRAQGSSVLAASATYRPSDLLDLKVPGVTPALAGELLSVEAIQARRRLIMKNIRFRRTNVLAASQTMPIQFVALLGALRSETLELQVARKLDEVDASMKAATERALSSLQAAAE
ncbi:hypothetical protein QMT40_001818 [Parvibaculaceae bacterium PLY_AMNH_Bact1]|nr:hypothetical protein QMT40_001818 [Parvibaculaceae bacterium PLY_AMNH_Bact1]